MASKIQNLLIIFGLIALAGVGYYLYAHNGGISLNNNSVDNRAAADTTEFLYRLNELKTIKLEGAIFNDTRFTSLVDSSDIVVPSHIGRSNPFIANN